MRKFAILGSPVNHSRSPQIHQAAYDFLGLDWSYERVEVAKSSLANYLNSNHGFSGFSVTMPLKEELLEWAQANGGEIDSRALYTLSANTLDLSSNGIRVFNTDVFGATSALEASIKEHISNIAILGNGATARSITMAVTSTFPRCDSIFVFARDSSKTALIQNSVSRDSSALVQWLPLEAAADFGGASLTINTLPAEVIKNVEVDVPLTGGYVFDVSYSSESGFDLPWPADRRISALSMLVWQAVAQLRVFVNGSPEVAFEAEEDLAAAMFIAAQS